MMRVRSLLRVAALCGLFALIAIPAAHATDLSLPPSDGTAGAYATSSQTYNFATGSEERHFSYRIPQPLVDAPAGTVPVVLLLHGGLPPGHADEAFMGDFLDGLDETAPPFSRYAYISVRAADVPEARCLALWNANRIDGPGLKLCLFSAVSGFHVWRFVGSSASTSADIDAPDAFTVDDPEGYVDVIALSAILQDFAETFPSLDLDHVFIATFSFGSHVADQVICSRSSMVRGVASITGSWLTRRQFGADGSLGGADGNAECGSGHEPGYAALTGASSVAYGRRDAAGYPSRTGMLYNRVPVFRSIGRADHNLTEGQTAGVAARTMALLNGVDDRVTHLSVLPDVDPSTNDGKAITLAKYQTPRRGERWNTTKMLVIGQCGLANRRGGPAFNPFVVPSVEGPGCTHGVWGKNNDESVGTDQHWPKLAMWFFSQF